MALRPFKPGGPYNNDLSCLNAGLPESSKLQNEYKLSLLLYMYDDLNKRNGTKKTHCITVKATH